MTKPKMLTPRQFADRHNVPYSTVMAWLSDNRIPTAQGITIGKRTYWQIPVKTKRPIVKRGAPKRKH